MNLSRLDEMIPQFTAPLGPEALPESERTGRSPEIDAQKLDPDAVKVILRLARHGHQAYLVGGCVRDLLLGRRPKDFDVATSAHPGEVRALFSNCRLIGRRFRLAHVYFKGGKLIEVSTFRAEPTVAASEGNDESADLLITEDNVFGTAEQDARRRDFTINGLFYDLVRGQVIDYVQGRRDLEARLIRTIGDPEIRLREDPVRILRAVRLACKLSLDVESATYAAMEGSVEDLPRCAPPRLLEETFRMLRAGVAAPSLRLLHALGALKFLLPPIHAYLELGGRPAEDSLYAFAGALDRIASATSSENGGLEDAILLAALMVPISRAAGGYVSESRGRLGVAPPVDELLRELTRAARLPKRIAQRCRMIVAVQPILSGESNRRGGLARFRRYPLFAEALTVLRITSEATGQYREALEAWMSGGVPVTAPESAPGPRRRRRRRRRGSR